MEKLEVINDEGEVTEIVERVRIHKEGLLHKEIHIWFYTPDGQIIFQRRAKDKDTWPDKLDYTVGGHVEIGDSYIDTAVKETLEETGLVIARADFIDLGIIKYNFGDEVTGTVNNVHDGRYAYCYQGDLNDLKVEEGLGAGFESIHIEELLNMSEENAAKFTPHAIEWPDLTTLKRIKKLIK